MSFCIGQVADSRCRAARRERRRAAQAITRFVRDTGHINFVTTGGSLRNSDTNTCTVNATSTTALSGIPAGTTIRNAYLYWGGSGGTADTRSRSTAARSPPRARSPRPTPASRPACRTSAPSPNVTIDRHRHRAMATTPSAASPWSPARRTATSARSWPAGASSSSTSRPASGCAPSTCIDGLAPFRGSQVMLRRPTASACRPANIDGRIAVFTLEGDPANSDQMNGIDEALRYNGSLLDDGINVTGSVPTDPAVRRHHQHPGHRHQLRHRRRPVRHQRVAVAGADQRHDYLLGRRGPGAAHGADRQRHVRSGRRSWRDHDAHRHFRFRRHRHIHHHRLERGRASSAKTTRSR